MLTILLALSLLTPGPRPGDVLTVEASAMWPGGESRSECRVVVINPAFADRVFHVCGSQAAVSAGIRHRWYQRIGASVVPVEGVVTSDGRIYVRGDLIEWQSQ